MERPRIALFGGKTRTCRGSKCDQNNNNGRLSAAREVATSASVPCSCVAECQQDQEKHGDHCYLWSDKDTTGMKTWDKAEAFCIQKGGHLASVASEATEAYVLRAKGNKTLKNLWLGGSDKEEEGVWKWSDGSPWNFTNWNKYQPTPLDVSSDEDCLQ